ncbi:MAG: flavin reductase family protein [Actinomycetota bacterium]|nr:flavin reductase family protein [Actinomycetota bacterium]
MGRGQPDQRPRVRGRPETGSPLILATPYWFECQVTDTVARGDHTIFVCEVINAGVRDAEQAPLLRDTGMNYGG